MQMNDGMVSGTLLLGIATLFFGSVTLLIRTSYKKKYDSITCSGCGITYSTTRNVKVEEDIELGKPKHIFEEGSVSEFNSEFKSV